MGDLLLRKVLPIELDNGNKGRGGKWFSSAKLRQKIERDFEALGMSREPFDHPVKVVVTRYLKPRQRKWDSSSCGRGNYKEIEDSLVSLGWFNDDSPRWITDTRFRQDSTAKDVPELAGKTMIEIYDAQLN